MADAPTGLTLGLGVGLLGILLGGSVRKGVRLKRAVRQRDATLAALHVSLEAARGEVSSLERRARVLEGAVRKSTAALARLHGDSLVDGDGPLPSLDELDALQEELRDALLRVRAAKGRALKLEIEFLDERRRALSLDLSATQMGIEGEERLSQMCLSHQGTPSEMEETDHEDHTTPNPHAKMLGSGCHVTWQQGSRVAAGTPDTQTSDREESDRTAFDGSDLDQAAGLLGAESEYAGSTSGGEVEWEVRRQAEER